MTVAIFGAGFLGRRLAADLAGAALIEGVDITDRPAVLRAIRESGARAVINAAGKTGRPNVDWCEDHQEETYRSNVIGPLMLASACAETETYLLHLGSGCIFYDRSPHLDGAWREADFANPQSYYSTTKYASDLVLSQLPNVAIARIRMPIDHVPSERNLITKLAGYRQVIDVENSVTVVDDLVSVVAALIDRRAEGIFHVTNPGTVRHLDLLRRYREYVEPKHTFQAIRERDLLSRGITKAPRSNCILASRLPEIGIAMRPIDEALKDVFTRYAASMRMR